MSIQTKLVLATLLLIVLVSGLADSFEFEKNELASRKNLWKLYERWSKQHAISRSPKQMKKRFNVFKENAKHVFTVNQMNKSYKLRLNQFGDMSNYEFVKLYARSNISHYREVHGRRDEFMYESATDVPSSMDWRDRGAVNAVKSQSQCAACWAFSAVAAVESLNQIKTKQMISLSEQELIDCDTSNHACDGGFMDSAFEFIQEKGGITTEDSYPYTSAQGSCLSSQPRVTINGYENVPPNNENALMQAVANQPVSVAMTAGESDFQFYSQGVFDESCGSFLNHAVLAIGYGTTQDGIDYWIGKNSWGVGWGEQGYLRLRRGVNQCQIAADASYPI